MLRYALAMIRHAIASDAAAIAGIQTDSWRATYRDIIRSETLAALSAAAATKSWLQWFLTAPTDHPCLVATDSNDQTNPARVIGYVMAGPARRNNSRNGRAEIQVLYLNPARQQQGIGRQLVTAAARALHTRGFSSLEIWSLAANPSRPFYDRLGGTVIASRRTTVARQRLDEVCYFWPHLTSLIALRRDSSTTGTANHSSEH